MNLLSDRPRIALSRRYVLSMPLLERWIVIVWLLAIVAWASVFARILRDPLPGANNIPRPPIETRLASVKS